MTYQEKKKDVLRSAVDLLAAIQEINADLTKASGYVPDFWAMAEDEAKQTVAILEVLQ
jgi:hypothetical protein